SCRTEPLPGRPDFLPCKDLKDIGDLAGGGERPSDHFIRTGPKTASLLSQMCYLDAVYNLSIKPLYRHIILIPNCNTE
ncbi:MAG: hypothetical protein AAF934_10630, partial [Bacteroidota bacterium]